jgi:hypothetical protein
VNELLCHISVAKAELSNRNLLVSRGINKAPVFTVAPLISSLLRRLKWPHCDNHEAVTATTWLFKPYVTNKYRYFSVVRFGFLSVFAFLAILPVSAQESLSVVDSNKGTLTDRQTPGEVSPPATGQLSTPATAIPGATSIVPASSFFGGVGIGAAITTFGSQYVYNKGTSEIYKNGVLTSTSEADGPAIPDPYLPSASNVVPAGQFGYFSRFKGSS